MPYTSMGLCYIFVLILLTGRTIACIISHIQLSFAKGLLLLDSVNNGKLPCCATTCGDVSIVYVLNGQGLITLIHIPGCCITRIRKNSPIKRESI